REPARTLAGIGRIEFAQESYLRALLLVRCKAAQLARVRAIHRQQQVEALEVRARDRARAAAELDAARAGSRRGARIRRAADMPAPGARGVELDARLQAGLAHERPHHALRGGRPADVAEAYEQHPHGHGHPQGHRRLHRCSALAPAPGWVRTRAAETLHL